MPPDIPEEDRIDDKGEWQVGAVGGGWQVGANDGEGQVVAVGGGWWVRAFDKM